MSKKTKPSWMVRKLLSFRKSGTEDPVVKVVNAQQEYLLAMEDRVEEMESWFVLVTSNHEKEIKQLHRIALHYSNKRRFR